MKLTNKYQDVFGCDRAALIDSIPLFDFNKEYLYGFDRYYDNYLTFYGFNNLIDHASFFSGMQVIGEHNLLCHFWRNPSSLKTVVVTHGLFDHSGIYLKFVESLITAGFSVFIFDAIGHGLSSGEPTAIESFDQYSDALATTFNLLTKAYSNQSQTFILAGQSTGCAVILNMFDKQLIKQEAIEKIVMFAPLARPRSWRLIRIAHFFLNKFLSTFPRTFSPSSGDEEFLFFLKHADPLQSQVIAVSWVSAMLKWGLYVQKISSIACPAFIVQGEKDTTVNFKYGLSILNNKCSKKHLFMVPQGQHQVVNESKKIRDKVFSKVIDFIAL